MSQKPRPRILQFGTVGQLGLELIHAAEANAVDLQRVTLEEADFTRPNDVVRAVEQARNIDVVVNAAAYTAVDKAETEEALARTINADTVGILAKACTARGLPLIHVSTDYVFDGAKTSPYAESDPTNPLSAYGRTKLAGEDAVRNVLEAHVIVRTSWIYSVHGSNFVKTMLRLGAERDVLKVVDDQYGAPTSAGDLARAILTIARRLASDAKPHGYGTFHYTGGGDTTWYGFAQSIFEESRGWAGIKARLEPIDTAGYPTPARRPRNSRLSCDKIKQIYNIETVPWRNALKSVLGSLKQQAERERR